MMVKALSEHTAANHACANSFMTVARHLLQTVPAAGLRCHRQMPPTAACTAQPPRAAARLSGCSTAAAAAPATGQLQLTAHTLSCCRDIVHMVDAAVRCLDCSTAWLPNVDACRCQHIAICIKHLCSSRCFQVREAQHLIRQVNHPSFHGKDHTSRTVSSEQLPSASGADANHGISGSRLQARHDSPCGRHNCDRWQQAHPSITAMASHHRLMLQGWTRLVNDSAALQEACIGHVARISKLAAYKLPNTHLSSAPLFSHEGGSGAACWSDNSTVAGTASCTARSSEAASAPPAAAAGWVLSANKDSLQQSRHMRQLQYLGTGYP